MTLTTMEIGIVFKAARDLDMLAAWTPEGGIRITCPPKRNWRKNPSKAKGHVYFILAKTSQMIKIGFSRDPQKRFTDLSTGSPEPLVLWGTVPGSFGAEALLHRRFNHLRIKGEWFKATDEVFEHLENMAEDAER
jgi:hypothetical protein